MANKKSSKLMIKKISKRTACNRMVRSRCRTFIKHVNQAIESGDKTFACKKLYMAEKVMQKTVNKGVFHWRTMARKISNLSAKIKAMPGEFLPKKIQ